MKKLSVYDYADFLNWGVSKKYFYRCNIRNFAVYTVKPCYDAKEFESIDWNHFITPLGVYLTERASVKVVKRFHAIINNKKKYNYALEMLERLKNNDKKVVKNYKKARQKLKTLKNKALTIKKQSSYEVGDMVLTIPLHVVEERRRASATDSPSFGLDSFVFSMDDMCDKMVRIINKIGDKYKIEGNGQNWTVEMFVGKVIS